MKMAVDGTLCIPQNMRRHLRKLQCLLAAAVWLCATICGCAETGAKDSSEKEAADMAITELRVNYEVEPSCVENAAFSWGISSEKRGIAQKSYRIVLAESRDAFAGEEFVWDSGVVESDRSFLVNCEAVLEEAHRYFWQVQLETTDGRQLCSDISFFDTALIQSGFQGAKWITQNGTEVKSAPMLRKEFYVGKKVKSAFLYASAAGLYEVTLNGKQPDGSLLNPGRTEYTKRIMYQGYHVTELIHEGDNVLGSVLGNGWYIGAGSSAGHSIPAFLCRLVIHYEDGSTEYIDSDESWASCENGPILYNDIFHGETYDAGREINGWDTPEYDASGWPTVRTVGQGSLKLGALVPQLSNPVKAMDERVARSVSSPQENVFIYDFGQNLAGVVSVSLCGDAGRTITLRHGEMLNDGNAGCDGEKGTLYTKNLRTAKATDHYTLKGGEMETYTPSFTFHGFRYVEITGLQQALPLEDVRAIVLYSGMEDTGRLETSDQMLNQLISNTYWGQRSNFISVPTDCPQRDERQGWSGDAQVFCGTAAYNMNVKNFYEKYITDLNDCQLADGSYPYVAPRSGFTSYMGGGNSGWADAGIIIPWIMYTRYGDQSYIEKYYGNMCRYIAYLESVSKDHIKSTSWTGDWLSIDENTQISLTDTAFCVYVCDLLSKMARLLGKEEDAQNFAYLAQDYRNAWCFMFLRPDGMLASDTQTAYVLALKFDIVEEKYRAACAARLNEKIVNNGYRLTTGFLGVSYLLPVLCDCGYTETAYRLLEQTEYPSWLYPVAQGATTIWERWNSYTMEGGFGDSGMNSFNHYSYGSVTEWMYSYMAGIRCDESSPAYRHFCLRPTVGGTVSSCRGEYNSVCGTIISSWTAENGRMISYECVVPANTTASLCLPAENPDMVTEGGLALEAAEGIIDVRSENKTVVMELASGRYLFQIYK